MCYIHKHKISSGRKCEEKRPTGGWMMQNAVSMSFLRVMCNLCDTLAWLVASRTWPAGSAPGLNA